MICSFVIWRGLAPLKSAAVTRGKIILSGKYKVIQHLEGGMDRDIKVKDGKMVAVGKA